MEPVPKLDLLILDEDPRACAESYTDADLAFRPGQYAELLRIAYMQSRGGNTESRHVLAKWAAAPEAWAWTYTLCQCLLQEQGHRFSMRDIGAARKLQSLVDGPEYCGRLPRFVQLTEKKHPGQAVKAYREAYKLQAAPCWTNRGAPAWWIGSEQLSLF